MSDDPHGLFYDLAAAIGRLAVLNNLARPSPAARVVRLRAAGLGLLPVTPEAANSLGRATRCLPLPPRATVTDEDSISTAPPHLLTGRESGFAVLTPALVELFERGSHLGPIAYVEANYLARQGWQSAVVWHRGRVTVGPLLLGRNEAFSSTTAPIPVALRALGLTALGRRDEFVVAGLGRRRTTQDWANDLEDLPW